MNALSPKLAGKFQVLTTADQAHPSDSDGYCWNHCRPKNGILISNFTSGVIAEVSGNPLFTAVELPPLLMKAGLLLLVSMLN